MISGQLRNFKLHVQENPISLKSHPYACFLFIAKLEKNVSANDASLDMILVTFMKYKYEFKELKEPGKDILKVCMYSTVVYAC